MTSSGGVFRDGRVGMFSISMFTEPGAQHSRNLTNVVLVTVTTLYTIYHTTVFFLYGFVFGADQQGPKVLKGLRPLDCPHTTPIPVNFNH